MLWNIYHHYDVDGAYGDAVGQVDHIATIEATEEEVKAFVEKWHKPIIYDIPYSELICGWIEAEPVEIKTISELEKDPKNIYGWHNRFMEHAEDYEAYEEEE